MMDEPSHINAIELLKLTDELLSNDHIDTNEIQAIFNSNSHSHDMKPAIKLKVNNFRCVPTEVNLEEIRD